MFPDKRQQILAAHAGFICQVVEFAANTDRRAELDNLFRTARENGWQRLVSALEEIVGGQRDPNRLRGLDEEDQIIAEAVLRGLQDPATLPDPSQPPDPAMAAPGLAHMIRAAATGNAQALVLVGDMADQMQKVGGDMGKLAGRIRPLINGERDPEKLCKGMSAQGEQLMLAILNELGKLGMH